VNLALMFRDGYPGRAPGQTHGTGAFGDWNTQVVRDCGIAGTFLMWLGRPGAAKIDAGPRAERSRELPKGARRTREYQNR
jgi:hypothetical protein